jgi:glycosyltransferase involved in cell wall biosynthesis
MNSGRINVLFIITIMELGGAESLVLNLVRAIDRKIFNPSVGWFNKKEPLKEFVDLGVPLHHFPKGKGFDFRTMNMISRTIRENRIHVVNSHHFISLVYCFYGCKIINGTKLVFTEHSEEDIERVQGKWETIGRILARYIDASVGVTDGVCRQLSRKFRLEEGKFHTITNGVDLSKYFMPSDERAVTRSSLGLGSEDMVIGIVANLRRNKNHLFLLNAFRDLVRENKFLKMVIVGKGFPFDVEYSEPEVRKFIIENGLEKNVLLLGFRPDVHLVLPLLDIFCLVSYKEGLPISLIEAMAAGLPVIGTDTVGIRDVIAHGKNGYLVRIGDVEDLKKRILMLIGDPVFRRKMGEISRSMAIEKYSFRECIGNYEKLFLSILKNRTRCPQYG